MSWRMSDRRLPLWTIVGLVLVTSPHNWMKSSFSFLLIMAILSCSESERKNKVKYTENPLVQNSLVDYVTPIINSFEIEKLKKWGFGPPHDLDKNVFEEKYGIEVLGHTKQKKQKWT